jgi:hypothetical protein
MSSILPPSIFRQLGAARDHKADYYRSRKIGFVVVTVDEKLTGKPFLSDAAVLKFCY